MIEVKTDTSGLEDLIAKLEGSDGDLAKVAEAMAEEIHEEITAADPSRLDSVRRPR